MQGDLFYSENLTAMDNQYLVFELPDELLNELEYKSLHIGGEPNQDAIVSGSKSSYLIKKCETSNTMLVVYENQILKSSKYTLKCEKTIPPLHQVLELLNQSPYTYLDQKRTKTYSYLELLQKVQASESEIQNYLCKLSAFEYKGSWRIFDEEYRIEVLKNFMLILMKHNWDEIRVRLVSQELPEVPYEILVALLQTIGSINSDIFESNKLKVYQMCASDLFLTHNEYILDEFKQALEKLQDSTIYRKFISKSITLEEIIEGLAVQRTLNYRTTIKYFPVFKLTFNLEERMQAMFGVKEKWTEKELRVYLEDVSLLSMPQLTMKYLKKVIEGNSILYTGKLN